MTNKVLSFFEKIGKAFLSIFKKLPTWDQSALGVLKLAAPVLTIILGLVDPAAVPVISPILARIETGMATVGAVIQDGTPAPGSSAAQAAETALNALKDDLGSILALAEVKNSAKVTEITDEVNGLVGAFDTLLQNLPTAAA